MNRKRLLIILIITLVVCGAVYVLTRQGAPITTNVAPTPLPVTTIAAISYPPKFDTTPANVVFTYAGQAPSLPTSLPTYSVSYPSNLPSQAETLARSWGVAAALSKPVPYVYDWIDPTTHVTYDDKAKTLSFSQSIASATTSTQLSTQKVMDQLRAQGFLSGDFALTANGSQTLSNVEAAEPGTPPIIATAYQATIANQQFPFIFSGLTPSASEIQTTQKGFVVSFFFYVTPALKPAPDRQVLTFAQAMQALNDQKGYLAGAGSTYSSYPYADTPSFTRVTLSSVSLGYLYVVEENKFVPIFIFEGLGYGSTQQTVTFYLRATS